MTLSDASLVRPMCTHYLARSTLTQIHDFPRKTGQTQAPSEGPRKAYVIAAIVIIRSASGSGRTAATTTTQHSRAQTNHRHDIEPAATRTIPFPHLALFPTLVVLSEETHPFSS